MVQRAKLMILHIMVFGQLLTQESQASLTF